MRYKESAVFSDVSAVIHCWSLVSVTKSSKRLCRTAVLICCRCESLSYPHMNRAALHALSVPNVAEAISCL